MELRLSFKTDLIPEDGNFGCGIKMYRIAPHVSFLFGLDYLKISDVTNINTCTVQLCSVTNTCSRSEYYTQGKDTEVTGWVYSDLGEWVDITISLKYE